ncbi:MAG: RICIN domain-containing protein [Solirubrobacterales bacterium]
MGTIEGRKSSFKGMLLIAAALTLITVSPASGDVGSLEAREYSRDFNVSAAQAENTLEVQGNGVEADIAGQLEERLGDRYAGVWFDNAGSEFVVPLLPGASGVGEEFAAADLDGGDFRTTPASSSWEALEAAQDRIDDALGDLIGEQLVQTSLDPRINGVVIKQAQGVGSIQQEQIQALAEGAAVNVQVSQAPDERFHLTTTACVQKWSICDTPMRGGVLIAPAGTPLTGGGCTAGFNATGNASPDRYVLTAGHCAASTNEWESFLSTEQPKYLGKVASWTFPTHDYASINVNGTSWDTSPWPSHVAFWGHAVEGGKPDTPIVNPSVPITGEGVSFKGQFVCHSGSQSGTSCGFVTAVGVTGNVGGGQSILGLTEFGKTCSISGDSGGPVFTGNTALGLYVADDSKAEPTPKEQEEFCKRTGFYQEITEATKALNVSVAPVAPQVTITQATALNGNPGWATIKGEVKAPNGTPITNKVINIKLFKWENNSWALKATPQVPVTNNAFELSNWNGVGPGGWLAKAVFPAQAPYGEASSNEVNEGSFTVKDGYRFVAKASGRCLDVYGADKENGASMQQWDCSSPVTQQNQVFTMVPVGGYVLLVARHSNRCVSVHGGLTEDGTPMLQWTCGTAPNNDSQLYKVVDAGSGYVQLQLKHSGKCLTVHGALKENGVPMLQWTCGDAGKWTIQSVDSGPIPLEAHITVGEVLHGQPGYVNVDGYVKSGAYSLAGRTISVNYQKEIGPSQWETKSSAQTTLNSEGYYSYPYMGVSPGNWRVRAVLPAGAPFAESASPYQPFEVKSGYQFIFRHSGQCMSLHGNLSAPGTPLLQWPCGSPPDPNQGQVFTLVPRGNGYHYVEINSTDQCVSVHGALQAPGTGILQWPCGGGTNQEWQIVPIAGQAPWFAMIARHSGQCASVTGSQNGASLVQWGCTWAGTQQWKFVPVN